MSQVCEGGVWDILLSPEQADKIINTQVELSETALQEKIASSLKTLAGKVAEAQSKLEELSQRIDEYTE